MSRITQATEAPARGASPNAAGPDVARVRTRRLIAISAAIVVLAWSLVELINLLAVHTTGPELYGVLVAALAVGAGVLNLILLRSRERKGWATLAVLILWAVVVLGGLAGTAAHIIGPSAGHGPIDPRPRPVAAPLVFTLLGLVGGVALWFGQRRSSRQVGDIREE
jgi:4-amino-4-deoxy-L-arabinose transferase-like glycosyltransferase